MANSAKKARLETNGGSKEDALDIMDQLQAVQVEIDALNERASEEILAVERRYVKLRQPHYERRAKFAEEIPGFWVSVLVNHGRLAELISDQDEEALQALTKIEVHEFDDIKSGYKIDFHFTDNPFFTNKCLTKEFHLSESGELSSKSTEVMWKPGKRLVPPSSSSGKPTVKRHHEPESFFRWFVDGNGGDFGGDEIGEIIKDDIWPNPLQFFLSEEESGEFDSSEFVDYGDSSIDNNTTAELDGEDDEDEDDGEDEDDDEEDDDDDDEEK